MPDDVIARFRDDGVAVLRSALDDRWLGALRDGVEHNRTHPSAWSHWYTNPGRVGRVLDRLRDLA